MEDVKSRFHINVLSARSVGRFEAKNLILSGKAEQVTAARAIVRADERIAPATVTSALKVGGCSRVLFIDPLVQYLLTH